MSSSEKKLKYIPSEIEPKWQKIWEEDGTYDPNLDKPKKPFDSVQGKPFYNLMMFPYPSAEGLHAGNMYAFTGSDIYGRFMRMKGFSVFEPIGLDGFGIHSENYALKVGVHPMDQAKISEENFYRQLHQTGNGYDWNRKLETYDPGYYKWTQWIFTQMFKKGLAVRKKSPVNFCPSCKTVLADEQVIDGKCERCGSIVEKRNLEQWFFKITDYAQRLLDNIESLNWSEGVKIAQKNWIGRSEGATIEFGINSNHNYLFLHAYKDSPGDVFWPWLKKEVEKVGSKVFAPQLPNPENPNIEEQVEYLLKNFDFNSQTVIVSHSLGGVTALKLLPKLKTKIHKLVMIAPPLKTEFMDGKRRESLEKATDWKFEYEKVRNKVNEIVVFKDIKDHILPPNHPSEIANNLNARLIEVVAPKPHFNSSKIDLVLDEVVEGIKVFTTRPDTLFGATFLVLSPEHPIVSKILDWQINISSARKEEILEYVETAKKKSEQERIAEGQEKTGIFTGVYVMNPVTKKEIPIWIAEYVVMGYGTGAIMAVPAHDQRDYEFAVKHGLPIIEVISNKQQAISNKQQAISTQQKTDKKEGAYVGEGEIVNSDAWNGWKVPQDISKVIKWLEDNGLGRRDTHYHLRDWLISRQRYWGPPIPIIYCSRCGTVPVPEKDLPVRLPYIKDYKPIGTGKSPLANHPDFYKTKCPDCGSKEATRETDVSDTFLDSAWYFFRYVSTGEKDKIFDRERVKNWLPVDIYIGGAEHSVLHLLYSRFMTMFLKDLGLIEFEEPYKRFFAHGLLIKEGAKMSKSKGNVITPDKYIEKLGADTMRCYLMFLGQFSQGGDFYDTGIEGMNRFLKRVWTLLTKVELAEKEKDKKVVTMIHKIIKGITEDIERLSYNTSLSKLMEFYNFVSGRKTLGKDVAGDFLKLLAPFAPHITEELWQRLKIKDLRFKDKKDHRSSIFRLQSPQATADGGQVNSKSFRSIHLEKWPEFEEKYLVEDEVTIAVQVNGKYRDSIQVESEKLKVKSEVERLATASRKVNAHLAGKKINNVIYVKGKIINFVVQ